MTNQAKRQTHPSRKTGKINRARQRFQFSTSPKGTMASNSTTDTQSQKALLVPA